MDHDHTAKGNTIRALALALVVLAATPLFGCGKIFKGKAAGERAVAHFHDQYNQGQLGEIWKDADPAFCTSAPRQTYDDFMAALQRNLGKVVSTSNAGWRVNYHHSQTTVIMSQDTVFERGKGTESFTFAMNGTNAVLLGYHLKSPELVPK